VSVEAIQGIVDERMAAAGESLQAVQEPTVSVGARQVLEAFGLDLPSLSLESLQTSGLLARRDIGSTELRREIHQEIFS
jgi:hypothetical protein